MNAFLVWISEEDYRLFHISEEKMERVSHSGSSQLPSMDSLADFIGHAGQIVVFGPDGEKDQFVNFLKKNRPSLATKIVGCETTPQPSDPHLAQLATKYLLKRR